MVRSACAGSKICLENICEFRHLTMNSLREHAGNFFGAQGFGAKSIRPFPRIQSSRHDVVQPAIFAPLETASRLTPSPPRRDTSFRGHDTYRLGYSSSLGAAAQRA